MTEETSNIDKIINGTDPYSVPVEDFFETSIEQYDAFDEAAKAKGTGYTCPSFPMFDRYMEGLESGLYFFAGESNGGKTALMLKLLWDYSTYEDNPISVVSKTIRYQNAIDSGAEGSGGYPELLEKRQEGLDYLKSMNNHFKIIDGSKIECGEQILDYCKKVKMYLEANSPETKII